MTCEDLYQMLEEMGEDRRRRTEVLVAYQPSWPLQVYAMGAVDGVEFAVEKARRELAECNEAPEDGDMTDDEVLHEAEVQAQQDPRFYIVAGDRTPDDTPYADRELWEVCR